jgi:hypothetical protein
MEISINLEICCFIIYRYLIAYVLVIAVFRKTLIVSHCLDEIALLYVRNFQMPVSEIKC